MKTIADLEAKKGYRFLKVIYIIVAIIVLVWMTINLSRNNRYIMGGRFFDYTQEQTEWLWKEVKSIYTEYRSISDLELWQKILDRFPNYKGIKEIPSKPTLDKIAKSTLSLPEWYVLDNIPKITDKATTEDRLIFTEKMSTKSPVEEQQTQKVVKYRLYTIWYSFLYLIIILVITEVLKRVIYYIFLWKIIPKRQ